ncbi:hypothetical protein AJ85_05675 [Alkalihalobacillus alcalophilus ATCC 27647 = CGMCC 1.3604]|uniref:Uncharacterized protein n=1 Tax=Alkalihalobacillus alcalophilus ATCC 27647 = CGMCC 1.3604 TaxID=1218173 RepID=A0A094WLP4_ALKAL|nr:hypothetical protein [Alkalihalobacillus alcalophilus]YP_009276837.1 hypothetical protein BH791_gp31 [Bacillus phage BalMu-1]AJA42409.1 hypothetical protein BalMu1_B31 [Bacillus phage BalMu-1]AJA42465.1 hypothetical protein BalMu1_A31 [Bacillus phage BalMu-1]KGA96863.1 hypothetical protein BALCAV_0213675 [Alkalihalobacillus alcalophilus ATCC 27647 = CGMCC 1.3604]MED1561152.1 hypothetical protein [Alkalihalobacillus alcalophilus]THG91312.1 hypothetical protein AJ85_05675 [Alkalihalobacillus
MKATVELQERLRLMLNDRIPKGGSEEDATFSNAEIVNLLEEATTIYKGAAVGWTLKAALLQGDIESYGVGQEKYDLTSLKDQYEHALAMAKQYSVLALEQEETATGSRRSGRMLKVKRPRVL